MTAYYSGLPKKGIELTNNWVKIIYLKPKKALKNGFYPKITNKSV